MTAAATVSSLPATERWVEVPGGRVWLTMIGHGTGLPLVALHGGPGSSHDYLIPLAVLGDERPVVLYDQLGSGRSNRPGDSTLWRIDRFLRELERVIEDLGLGNLHLLGHSWGTMLALEYALAHPGKLASLTLVSPCLSMRRIREDMARLKQGLPPAVRDAIDRHEAAGTTDSGMYRAASMLFHRQHVCRLPEWPGPLQRSQEAWAWDVYRTMWGPAEFSPTGNLRDYEREDRLGELGLPVLYLCGRHDEITPEATAAYHEKTPGSQMVVFEESSHLPNLEEKERFLQVLRGFLRATGC